MMQYVQAAETVSVSARAGVTQSFLLVEQDNAVASLLLFPGGDGLMKLKPDGRFLGKKTNFLVRSRQKFKAAGFHVAIADAPSDRQEDDGMFYGFRTTTAHAEDIQAMVDDLRKRFNKPVWLVGTSRGTESVANAAIRQIKGIAGIVLTASMSEENAKGDALPELALDRIRLPVFIASHEEDKCWVTPASGIDHIRDGLRNALVVESRLFTGGDEATGRECGGKSAHGFLGIEQQVVDAIDNFVRQHSL
jgi:hypothetical protein